MYSYDIKTFDVCDCSFDDLKIFSIHVRNVIEGFNVEGFNIPEWLFEKQQVIKRELEIRTRAEKQRKLKMLKMRRETLLPDDEKLKKVDTEIVNLEKELL